MFTHIFKYRLKCLMKDKETIFWTLLFPIILSVFFTLAFSDIGRHEIFKVIKVAVVDEKNSMDVHLKSALDSVSEGEDPLFDVTYVSKGQAEEMLHNHDVTGIILTDPVIELIVDQSGMEQSMIRGFLDHYIQSTSTVTTILAKDATKAGELLKNIGYDTAFLAEKPVTRGKPNNITNYFYTLIAMACFYGGLQGSRDISEIQANNTITAARLNVTPVHKMKIFLAFMAASLLVHFAKMLILLGFLILVLHVDFGAETLRILLTTLAGSLMGLSFGAFVSALLKKSEGIKIAIMIGVSMFLSFLAGMMYQGMKYIIARKAPALSWLNPLNVLTDAYYSLYYYNTYTRYVKNMLVVGVFILLFSLGTYFVIRRRKYASL